MPHTPSHHNADLKSEQFTEKNTCKINTVVKAIDFLPI